MSLIARYRSRFAAGAIVIPPSGKNGPFGKEPPEPVQPQKNKHSKEDSHDAAMEASTKADASGLRADHVSAAMAHEVAANIAQAHGDSTSMDEHDAAASEHYKQAAKANRDPIATTHYKTS